MPSLLHEGLLLLVRDQPELVAKLLAELFHVNVPRFTEARLAEATLHQLVPIEYHADAVVLFVDDQPVFGTIVEAQLQPDNRKLYTWPLYGVAARARYECPFEVIVLTTDPATMRWAMRPIDLGNGVHYPIHVIGPDGIPVVTDVESAIRDPHVAMLSVMAHGDRDPKTAVAIAAAALAAIRGLPEDKQVLYSAIVESSLGEAARKALEMLPDAKQFIAQSQRRVVDRAVARAKAEGEALGRAEGEALGRAEGKSDAILQILAQRELSVTAEQRQRIVDCVDLEVLAGWLARSLVVRSTAELFG